MKTTTLRVTVKDPDDETGEVEHEVQITHQDRLRAEQMAHQLGVPGLAAAPLTGTTMWAWAAMRRLKLTDAKAKTFVDDLCLDIENVKEAEAEVDPTQPDPVTD